MAEIKYTGIRRWLKTEAYPHHVYCANCFATAIPNEKYWTRWGLKYKYCPNCGVKMNEYENIPTFAELFKY